MDKRRPAPSTAGFGARARSRLWKGPARSREVVSAKARTASPLRETLDELMAAAGLVRRIGTNLNQAVAKLNATGQRSDNLLPAAEFCVA